jgi:hypothetical protein
MLILLLPLTTIFVALVGFYVWHRQLIRKRLFEVADAALSAFCRAEAAIAHAREPTIGAGEGATRKRGALELPAYSGLLDRLYVPVERLKQSKGAFEELERTAVNVEVHFGSELAAKLREPLRAYRRIAVATACRMSNVGLSAQAKVDPDMVRRWEDEVYAGVRRDAAAEEVDRVAFELDAAKWDAEQALRPYVEAPTFREFLSLRKLPTLIPKPLWLVRPGPPSGYSKIAVYAELPPGR